jgi:hypothetical protein
MKKIQVYKNVNIIMLQKNHQLKIMIKEIYKYLQLNSILKKQKMLKQKCFCRGIISFQTK